MKAARTVLCIALVITVIALVITVFELLYADPTNVATPRIRSSIPYVATHNDTVQDMLWMASVGKNDVVYDLGSGDGRIVISAVRDFGARRAVGIEIDPNRIAESRKNAQKAGVTQRVEFIEGDLFATDLQPASVVTMFLGHESNIRLRAKMLRMLRPGTRIISHQFGMGEWLPDKTLTVRTVFFGMWGTWAGPFNHNPHVPDYTGNEGHFATSETVLMWVVPAPVAGIWRGKIDTAQGPQDCQITLHQRLSEVTGTIQLAGKSDQAEWVRVDIRGDHVRFFCDFDRTNPRRSELMFDGHVEGNTMKGTLAVTSEGQLQEHAWQAQRDKVDFTGTWEWPCASGSRSVKLRIERRDGHLVATYIDREKEVPVTDFYDCGGGFYFTLLIGRSEGGVRITEDTGWLIGQGVLDKGTVKGKIEFYPHPGRFGERKADQPVIQDWAPPMGEK